MGKEIKDLTTDKLKRLLLTYNILAVLGGIGAITAIVFYFLDRENNQAWIVVGAGLGAGLSYLGALAGKIKKELKNRTD